MPSRVIGRVERVGSSRTLSRPGTSPPVNATRRGGLSMLSGFSGFQAQGARSANTWPSPPHRSLARRPLLTVAPSLALARQGKVLVWVNAREAPSHCPSSPDRHHYVHPAVPTLCGSVTSTHAGRAAVCSWLVGFGAPTAWQCLLRLAGLAVPRGPCLCVGSRACVASALEKRGLFIGGLTATVLSHVAPGWSHWERGKPPRRAASPAPM